MGLGLLGLSRVRVKSQELESKVKGHGSMIKRPEVKGQRLGSGVKDIGLRLLLGLLELLRIMVKGQVLKVRSQRSWITGQMDHWSKFRVQGQRSMVRGSKVSGQGSVVKDLVSRD